MALVESKGVKTEILVSGDVKMARIEAVEGLRSKVEWLLWRSLGRTMRGLSEGVMC